MYNRRATLTIKPRPHQQQCRSNIRLCRKIVRLVAFDNVAGMLILGLGLGLKAKFLGLGLGLGLDLDVGILWPWP